MLHYSGLVPLYKCSIRFTFGVRVGHGIVLIFGLPNNVSGSFRSVEVEVVMLQRYSGEEQNKTQGSVYLPETMV